MCEKGVGRGLSCRRCREMHARCGVDGPEVAESSEAATRREVEEILGVMLDKILVRMDQLSEEVREVKEALENADEDESEEDGNSAGMSEKARGKRRARK